MGEGKMKFRRQQDRLIKDLASEAADKIAAKLKC